MALEQVLQLTRDPVVGHQEAVIVRERNEMSVEQPVHRPRQGDAVLHDVGTALRDGPYMGRLYFRLPVAVDDPEPGHCACVLVAVADLPTEASISNLAVHEHLGDPPLLLLWRCSDCGAVGDIEDVPDACPDCGAPREHLYYWIED
jgi:hypothetical protein